MTLQQVFVSILVFGILAGLSYFSFRWRNPVLFMVLFADAMITGLYAPDLLCGQSETTSLGITIGMLLLGYALMAAGMSFVEMFRYGDDEE